MRREKSRRGGGDGEREKEVGSEMTNDIVVRKEREEEEMGA